MPNNFTKKFPLTFKNPLELLLYYDDELRSGKYSLYPWQVDVLKNFGRDIPPGEILRMAVNANNGSGKSKFILAPCIIWPAVSFDSAQCTVTSASAFQLDTQTEKYVNQLCRRMNQVHMDINSVEVWKYIQRKKLFYPTDSHIDLFATDEDRKAEGHHPVVLGGEFALFIDEGKSIPDPIFDALDRCNGCTRRLDVSSPGNVLGHFYDINTRPDLGWWVKKVTVFDCPHIKESEIKSLILKHGINDPLIRSSLFAEFTSADAKTVITIETLNECIKLWREMNVDSRLKLTWAFGEHSGLDLSAGGDEMVLVIFDGNIMRAMETGRYRNTSAGVDEIIHWIRKHNLNPKRIWADDGGVGKGMIDSLHDKGFKVKRVLNNWRAMDNTRYGNRGTEMWFNFKRFVEEMQVSLLDDPLLKSQLSNRYYKTTNSINKLESKEQAKANGHPSPDRADACVLAWFDYNFPLDLEKLLGKEIDTTHDGETSFNSLEEIIQWQLKLRHERLGLLGLQGVDSSESSINRRNLVNKLYQNIPVTQNLIVDRMSGGGKPIDKLRGRLRRLNRFN